MRTTTMTTEQIQEFKKKIGWEDTPTGFKLLPLTKQQATEEYKLIQKNRSTEDILADIATFDENIAETTSEHLLKMFKDTRELLVNEIQSRR